LQVKPITWPIFTTNNFPERKTTIWLPLRGLKKNKSISSPKTLQTSMPLKVKQQLLRVRSNNLKLITLDSSKKLPIQKTKLQEEQHKSELNNMIKYRSKLKNRPLFVKNNRWLETWKDSQMPTEMTRHSNKVSNKRLRAKNPDYSLSTIKRTPKLLNPLEKLKPDTMFCNVPSTTISKLPLIKETTPPQTDTEIKWDKRSKKFSKLQIISNSNIKLKLTQMLEQFR
jgi:hypothetical protein